MEKRFLSTMILVLLTIGLFTTYAISADVPMMTKEQLKAMLGNPDLVIFDARPGPDYFSSDSKIKGSTRPMYVRDAIREHPKEKIFVIYFASPNEEVSVTRVKDFLAGGHLGSEGYTKVYVLKGGWEEWLKAGYPTEKK